MKNRKSMVIGAIVLVLLIGIMSAVYFLNRPETAQGAKSFTVEVVDNNGETATYEGRTDAEYLRQALEELDGFTMTGSDGEYGLFVDTVNGVTADYSSDGAYWAFYVNGALCPYGVDSQPVLDGDSFRIVYEVYLAE